MDLDDRIDHLFTVPLASFVAARNELAKALRREGKREAAERIKKLGKPSVAAWLLNQLQRQEPELLARLREAGHDMLVCSQTGRGEIFAAAAAEQRRVQSEVVTRAEALASAAGLPLSPIQQDRLESTVRALAAWGRRDPPEPPGRLVSEVEPPPLELLLEEGERPRQTQRVAIPSTPNREPEPRPDEPLDDELRAKIRWLELRLARHERERDAKIAAREAAQVDQRIRSDLAERLAEEADDLERQVALTRARAEEARVVASAAADRAEQAMSEVAEAEAQVEEARRELDEARAPRDGS